MRLRSNLLLLILPFFIFACSGKNEKKLPYIGHHEVDPANPADTLYHTIPPFAVTNQEGKLVTNDDFKGKIHVADFFFTSCPSICPKMTSQLKRIQSLSKDLDIKIISFSIDPKRDSVETLKKYAEKNGLDTKNWDLVTGDADEIYELGMDGYNLSAMEDESAPGGYLHSQMVVLVDKEGHIRGMYDGTETVEMDKLLDDIKILMQEYE
jgi:protein SCO1